MKLHQTIFERPSSGQRYLALVSSMHMTEENFITQYQSAWELGNAQLLERLLNAPAIERQFAFLGPLLERLKAARKFSQLPFPFFSERSDFKCLAKSLCGEDFNRGVLKQLGQLTQAVGVNVLNNTFALKALFGQELRTPLVLKLNHERSMIAADFRAMQDLSFLCHRYTPVRMLRLLCENPGDSVRETQRLVSDREVETQVLLERLPEKPRTFREIHDCVSDALKLARRKELLFTQEISPLQGETVLGFKIEVPSSTRELIETSDELCHCVHGYDVLVARGECQILNLTRAGKRCYTIELRKRGEDFYIVQFKGYRNESTMEGPQGGDYRRDLMKLILKLKQVRD